MNRSINDELPNTINSSNDATLKRGLHVPVNNCNTIEQLDKLWEEHKDKGIEPIFVNKVMSKALMLEEPHFAVDVFEEAFNFVHESSGDDPAMGILEIAESVDVLDPEQLLLTASNRIDKETEGKVHNLSSTKRRVLPKASIGASSQVARALL